MNANRNQPGDDAENIKHFVQLLDRLTKTGFIKEHGYVGDAHVIGFSDKGWGLIRQIQEIEAAGPALNDEDRRVLFGVLRSAKPMGPTGAQR